MVQKVSLNHFRLLRVVGKGAFGKVRIVERKDSGLTFALKYIRKDEGWQYEPDGREIGANEVYSGANRECAQHPSRATDAGTYEPPVSLQSTIQLPGF